MREKIIHTNRKKKKFHRRFCVEEGTKRGKKRRRRRNFAVCSVWWWWLGWLVIHHGGEGPWLQTVILYRRGLETSIHGVSFFLSLCVYCIYIYIYIHTCSQHRALKKKNEKSARSLLVFLSLLFVEFDEGEEKENFLIRVFYLAASSLDNYNARLF